MNEDKPLSQADLPFLFQPDVLRVFLGLFVVSTVVQLAVFSLWSRQLEQFLSLGSSNASIALHPLDFVVGIPVGILLALGAWHIYKGALPGLIAEMKERGVVFVNYTPSGIQASGAIFILILPSLLLGFYGAPPLHFLRMAGCFLTGYILLMFRLLRWVEQLPEQ